MIAMNYVPSLDNQTVLHWRLIRMLLRISNLLENVCELCSLFSLYELVSLYGIYPWNTCSFTIRT